jgi:hypothetical protein
MITDSRVRVIGSGNPQFDDSSGRYTQSMSKDWEVTSLEELLERVCQAEPDAGRVSLDAILDVVGCRSFGPLLVVAGLLTLAPVIGDIPGVPTIVGALVFLIAIQLLFHREHVWLPRFLLNRSIERGKLHKAIGWLYPPARFVDRWSRARLTLFAEGAMIHVVIIVCLGIAMTMPVMEVIPFSANAAGGALTAYGLALIARDGLLALIAFAFTGVAVWSVAGRLLA